jgi:hypothetical protein
MDLKNMQSFKQFLVENKMPVNSAPWHLKTEEEVAKFVIDRNLHEDGFHSTFIRNEDGSYDIKQSITLMLNDNYFVDIPGGGKGLPFPFHRCRDFYIGGNITDLTGFPQHLDKITTVLINAPKLKSLKPVQIKTPINSISFNCNHLEEFGASIAMVDSVYFTANLIQLATMDIIKGFTCINKSVTFSNEPAFESFIKHTLTWCKLKDSSGHRPAFHTLGIAGSTDAFSALDVINANRDKNISQLQTFLLKNGLKEYTNL